MRVGHLFHPSKRTTPGHVARQARCHPSVPIGVLTPSHLCEKRIVKVFGTRNLNTASTRRVKPSVWKFAPVHDFVQGGQGQSMTTVAGALLPQFPARCGPLRCESALRHPSLCRDSSLHPPRNTRNGLMLHTLAAVVELNSGWPSVYFGIPVRVTLLEQYILRVVITVDPRQSQRHVKVLNLNHHETYQSLALALSPVDGG
jgi:hypothetical protein